MDELGRADVIALHHHRPHPEDGAKLMRDFLDRSAGTAGLHAANFVDAPLGILTGDEQNPHRLTDQEISWINDQLRREDGLGFVPVTRDEIEAIDRERSGNQGAVHNKHIGNHTIDDTMDGTDSDDNLSTAGGFLKQRRWNPNAPEQSKEARRHRIVQFLTQLDQQRRMLQELYARIERLEKEVRRLNERIDKFDANLVKIERAKAILADERLNTAQGAVLRTELSDIQNGLRVDGIDLGVQTNSDGTIDVESSGRNVERVQTETQEQRQRTVVERDRVNQELKEAHEAVERAYEKNPELRETRGVVNLTPRTPEDRAVAAADATAAVKDVMSRDIIAKPDNVRVTAALPEPSDADIDAEFDTLFGEETSVAELDVSDTVDAASEIETRAVSQSHASEFETVNVVTKTEASAPRALGSFAAAADGVQDTNSITKDFAAVAPDVSANVNSKPAEVSSAQPEETTEIDNRQASRAALSMVS